MYDMPMDLFPDVPLVLLFVRVFTNRYLPNLSLDFFQLLALTLTCCMYFPSLWAFFDILKNK